MVSAPGVIMLVRRLISPPRTGVLGAPIGIAVTGDELATQPGLASPAPCAGRSSALQFALLLWLPLLLFELLFAYPLSPFAVSPVLRRAFALAALVCLAITCLVWASATLSASLIDRVRTPTIDSSAALCAMAITGVSSVLILSFATTAQQWAFDHYGLAPEIGLLIAVLAACAAATLAIYLVSMALPLRWAPFTATVISLASLSYWMFAVFERFEVESSKPKMTIVALSSLALLLLLCRQYPGFAPGLFHRGIFRILPLLVGVVGPLVGVAVAGPLLAGASAAPLAGERRAAPNVLMIMIDTLRADHTSTGGYSLDTTPNLRKAAQGRATYFSKAIAAGTATIPSVKSLFMSHPPSHYRGEQGINRKPPAHAWTMAQAFKEAGYRTAAFTANPLIDGRGFKNGFDEFRVLASYVYLQKSFFLHDLLFGKQHWVWYRRMDSLGLHKEIGPNVGKLGKQWLKRNGNVPFFLYIHLLDPHWPYYDRDFGLIPDDVRDIENPYSHVTLLQLSIGNPANAEYRDKAQMRELIARYDEEIRFADQTVGELLERLEHLGLDDSTLVVVVGDHGEEFFEHNGFSHGHDVYEEQSHVPLLIVWPDRPEFSGLRRKVDVPVSLLDVFPTLMDYLVLPPPDEPLSGYSLRPLLEEEKLDEWNVVLTESASGRVRTAYREGDLKVRFSYKKSVPRERADDVAVYDLNRDPRERRPLAASDPRQRTLVTRAIQMLESSLAVQTLTVQEVEALEPRGQLSETIPTFRWTAGAGATQYRLLVYDVNAEDYVIDVVVSGTSHTAAAPLNTAHDYKFKVQALSAAGWSAASPWAHFNY